MQSSRFHGSDFPSVIPGVPGLSSFCVPKLLVGLATDGHKDVSAFCYARQRCCVCLCRISNPILICSTNKWYIIGAMFLVLRPWAEGVKVFFLPSVRGHTGY